MADLIAKMNLKRESLRELDEADDNSADPSKGATVGYLRKIDTNGDGQVDANDVNADGSATAGIYIERATFNQATFKKFADSFHDMVETKLGVDLDAITDKAALKTELDKLPADVRNAYGRVMLIQQNGVEAISASSNTPGNKGTQILTNVTGNYDVGPDWNDDVYTMNMWRVGGEASTIYRVEVTFNVDGMSDTGYEGAARWVFIIDASHKNADDRIKFLGLDPLTTDESGADGAFIVPENTKTDYDNVISLSSIVGLQYTANPYWSYNTNESVTSQQMLIRLNTILDEIAMANKDGGAAKGFSDAWMGKTVGVITNSNPTGTTPTPTNPPAGQEASTGTAAPAAPATPAAPAAPTVVPPTNNGEAAPAPGE